jgi:HD-like signal output (HDOD) protein
MALSPPASAKKKPAEALSVAFDEELWFGTENGESAELAAAQSMAATAGRVVGAKPFPAAARRLADLARDESTKTGELVQVLEQDPALSAKLLRMVNSAGFGLRQRCATVRHAVTLVGSEQLYRMATTAAVLDLFDAQSEHAVQVLEHSAVVGAFCRYLGAHLSLRAEELFTAGMLHDIGKLMLLETLGAPYGKLLDTCAGHANALFLVERESQGFDHGVLAAHVLKEWNIPDPIPKIVAWHHEPTRAYASSTLHATLVQTLRLADALELVLSQGVAAEQLPTSVGLEALNYLDISEAQLVSMYDELYALRESTLAHARGDTETQSVDCLQTGTRHKAPVHPPVEVPRQFPCVSCGNPSFGATCVACKGYVCPEHPLDAAGWCPVCAGAHGRQCLAWCGPRRGRCADTQYRRWCFPVCICSGRHVALPARALARPLHQNASPCKH